MGLCKCSKKKVTNQFCFEHATNVCEHCMVAEHPRVGIGQGGAGGQAGGIVRGGQTVAQDELIVAYLSDCLP